MWSVDSGDSDGNFPEWLQLLVRDEDDDRDEWKGMSGQLRTYSARIGNKLASSASAIDGVVSVKRNLQEAIGSRSDAANDTVLRTLRMDVNQLRDDLAALSTQNGEMLS